ncbi:FdhF/YdeP family oxidoreductase [Hyphomicrobium sp.]|uniref:FdhF/YdeP family oxidoreductase n=1 Tax=Hyphomicrobium sp. TaxID=82 RepID=UPI002D791EA0|nr:FdhF/YdeP family oxidoreductase [Hyphomicrobium sp.]HET6389782.1 FdhF/YdeP family oxidoreductase [Hyphomicrobium sp.]
MSKREVPGVGVYGGPAGGWGALQSVAKALRAQMALSRETTALSRVNQARGFDCPGCAWPDPRDASSFEFCENGAKAVAWEATRKRTGPEFFEAHTVSELWEWTDYALEDSGRLTHPMVYDAAVDRYRPISWEDAFQRIGELLRALPDPNMAEFYTSGRTSNEAAFLYQLFVREFGTNNFPDCSNMCHEATSIGLPESIGVGKGTVTLEDFDGADMVFCIGHNPGTNHPRMLSTLRAVAKRGGTIIVINPLRERGLERFTSPQSPVEMLTLHSTQIATIYHQVKVGGDAAMLKGIMKALFALDAERQANGQASILDRSFIEEHTQGLPKLIADIEATSWEDIERCSGISRADIEDTARRYASANRVIFCYGMGVTQHRHGTAIVQQIANLALIRGNIGIPGAGICPLRGHSNVQGDRTVGITEKPSPTLLQNIERTFGFRPPSEPGHGAIEAIQAMIDGRSRALVSMGGNLAVAMSDRDAAFKGARNLDLAVHIATKLNRSQLLVAKNSFILPCLGRTELDEQATGPQSVTVEDSVSYVHASAGRLTPVSTDLKSEAAIVAGLAKATLPDTKVGWDGYIADYDRIRDAIEKVFPAFENFNERIRNEGGFHLYIPAAHRIWDTPSKKANFIVFNGLDGDPRAKEPGALLLATIRSHDQYNTTIYGFNDRYRGITGRRDVIFLNQADLASRGLAHGDVVDVEVIKLPDDPGPARVLQKLTAVAFEIAKGSAAAYYPEANNLVDLGHYDIRSGTPAYKSIPVRIRASAGAREKDSRNVLAEA